MRHAALHGRVATGICGTAIRHVRSQVAANGRVATAAAAGAACIVSVHNHAALCDDASSTKGPSAATLDGLSQLRRIWHPPPFSVDAQSRFELSTYAGRALHYLDVLGDLSMLAVGQDGWDASERLLCEHAAGRGSGDDPMLWRAKKVQAACVHPETGELIPSPCRFSAFAPANLLICTGLLWASGASLRASAFFQWLNQSYNVAVNHCNRSSSSPPPERLAAAYVGATSASVGCAVLLQHLGSTRLRGHGRVLQLTVPMVGVSIGAVVNLLLTRSEELELGIELYDVDGHALGRSQGAARTALAQCSATRVAWTVALLTLAPIVSSAVMRGLLPATVPRSVSAVVEIGSTFFVIWLSVPLCIALYPQHTNLPGVELEVPFQGHERVFFHKGL